MTIMKKLMMLLPLAALVLTSCSSDNVEQLADDVTIVNYPEGAIWFSTDIETTRGLTTAANFREFKVTGVHSNAEYAFSNLIVTSENGTVWTYDTGDEQKPFKYWPADNTDVNFYAYAPSSLQEKVVIDNAYGKQVTGFKQEQTVANQIDVLSAYATGSKSSNAYTGVTLDFKHALSQIEIKAKNSQTDKYTVKVKGVKLCRVNDEGNMLFQTAAADYPTWNTLSGKQSFIKKGDTETTLTGSVQSIMFGNDNFLMLPQSLTAWDGTANDAQEGAYLAVLCQIVRLSDNKQIYPDDAGKYGFSAVPIGTKWEVGHKYVYTLDFFGAGDGAGQVDPDPKNPENPNDNDVDDKPKGDDGEGGDPIIDDAKSPIKFTVTITDWVNQEGDNSVIDL